MKICPNCHQSFEAGNFCPICGTKVLDSAQPAMQTPPAKPIQPAMQTPPAKPIQPAMQTPPAKPIQPAMQTSPAKPIQPAMQAPPVQPIQPTMQAPPAQPAQQFCPRCGAPVRPGTPFCTACGAQLQAMPARPAQPKQANPFFQKLGKLFLNFFKNPNEVFKEMKVENNFIACIVPLAILAFSYLLNGLVNGIVLNIQTYVGGIVIFYGLLIALFGFLFVTLSTVVTGFAAAKFNHEKLSFVNVLNVTSWVLLLEVPFILVGALFGWIHPIVTVFFAVAFLVMQNYAVYTGVQAISGGVSKSPLTLWVTYAIMFGFNLIYVLVLYLMGKTILEDVVEEMIGNMFYGSFF